MTLDLSTLGQYGAIGVCLIVFIYLHIKQQKSADERIDKLLLTYNDREKVMQENINRDHDECREDTQRLVKRIESLEDDRGVILFQTVEALKLNAKAFAELTEVETDRIHRNPGERT